MTLELTHLLFVLVPAVGWLWRRVHTLEMDAVRMKTQLEHGDKKFDEMAGDLKDVKETLHRLEKQFSGVAPALAREAGV